MKVLLVGDGVVKTGFAKMNHAYLEGLRSRGHEVHMLAINYHGDPHGYPYPIYPCTTPVHRYDMFGIARLKPLVEQIQPDLVCITNDPWNFAPYLEQLDGAAPAMLSVAVDGANCRGAAMNGAAHAVFWTKFGEQEARLGGYTGASSVIPLGVDLEMFYPVPKADCRESLPESMRGAFIVGCVGRNQPRKRIDLTMLYFAEWVKTRGIEDAWLFLHVAPTGEDAYDLYQLAEYAGISSRLIVPAQHLESGRGIPEEKMRRTYSAMDVVLSCTQGEGWGLCHMEAMACGTPNIVPDWAALGEWPEDAAIKVPCTSVACTPNGINVVGGIADRASVLQALDSAYCDRETLAELSARGLHLTARSEFQWDIIGREFAVTAEQVVERERERVVAESRKDKEEASA